MMSLHQHEPTALMEELIHSCRDAQERFRCAAETVSNEEWKRLFSIYAQQRTRFAQELRAHLPACAESADPECADETPCQMEWDEALRECLDADQRSLDAYSRALAARNMPTKAHFLVAAQYSLLRRVHERVRGICANRSRECELTP